MQINTSVPDGIRPLVDCLERHSKQMSLDDGQVYFDFPVYKALDEGVLVAQTMVISRYHGVMLFKVSQETNGTAFDALLDEEIETLNRIYTSVFTRIMRNDKLKTGRSNTIVPIFTIIYAPYLANQEHPRERAQKEEVELLFTESQLLECINDIKSSTPELQEILYEELLSSIEGSKGLVVPNIRETVSETTKAFAANEAEKEIMQFDSKQKTAYLTPINGVSRIRGLAGSGKTVILCMKAALLHLREPQSSILYTFYTKSLYQHVRRLITRFYRQFNDQDPDWDKIQVRHAWGSENIEGVYSQACSYNNIPKLSFAQARIRNMSLPFDAVCKDFMEKVPNPEKMYDYVLIDEGQDFPTSFIRMCLSLVEHDRILFAYDDLQTIFQHHVPQAADIFGSNPDGTPRVRFTEDQVLPKCYRNPREILVVAHALGFGIYAKSISQMIKSSEYWNDIGYEISDGELAEGQEVSILRPEKNSLIAISDRYNIKDIIRYKVNNNYQEEVLDVCACINDDINNQNLHPEDVLVLSADDRYAQRYLSDIEGCLAQNYNIRCNNVHADKFSVGNFQEKGRVTLSTIHKAKGNEAYSVYIVGIEALIPAKKNYRARNLIFTAMTRAKGWVRLSGLGKEMEPWVVEIEQAIQNFPYLKFKYPTENDIKLMERDMEEAAAKENKWKRMIDEMLSEMSQEEAERLFLDHMHNKE